MRILFIADPNSIHDVKWITYFTNRNLFTAFLLPRREHEASFLLNPIDLNVNLLPSIEDFSIVRFYRTISTAIRIKKIVVEENIDIINVHYAEPNALWCIFRWYFKVPMIITTLGTDVLKTIPEAFEKKSLINFLVAPAYKKSFRNADWVTGTSRKQLDSVAKFSRRNGKISIIRTGVDIRILLSNTLNYFPLKDNKPFILFPRYIKPLYNHEFCIEAISILPENIKTRYKMIFLGRNAGDMAYQEQLLDLMQKNYDVEFEFIGKQSQEALFELYKRSSLVVMTPKSDGSPVSAMEALLCGTKVILGPLDYDKDIFSENVVQLSSWKPEELSYKIASSLSPNNEKQTISDKIVLLMDRDSNMKKMMEIYTRLKNESRR